MRILPENMKKKKTKINIKNSKVGIKEITKTQRESMISTIQKDAALWDQLLD